MKHICSRCKRKLDEGQFSLCSKRGRQRYCKQCRSNVAKLDRGRINRAARAYYEKKKPNMAQQAKRVKWRRSAQYRYMKKVGYCLMCLCEKDLCIHHRDNDLTNNSISNLVVLCRSCHSKFHKEAVCRK